MKIQFTGLLLIVLLLVPIVGLGAQAWEQSNIPGLGLFYVKAHGQGATVNIPRLGEFDFRGRYQNSSDFRLTGTVPVDRFTDYVPYAGTLLSLAGLSEASLVLSSRGAGMELGFESGGLGILRNELTEILSYSSELKAVIEAAIGTFELQDLSVSGEIDGDRILGAIRGNLSVFGIVLPFQYRGDIGLDALVDAVAEVMLSEPVMNAFEALGEVVIEMGTVVYESSIAYAALMERGMNAMYDETMAFANDAVESVEHWHHSYETCYNECVPQYSRAAAGRLLQRTNQAVIEYYAKVAQNALRVSDPTERAGYLLNSWTQLEQTLDSSWGRLNRDDTVRNYFTEGGSKNNGQERHKRIVQTEYDHHVLYRREMWTYLTERRLTINQVDNPLDRIFSMAHEKIPVILAHKDTLYAVTTKDASEQNGTRHEFHPFNGGLNQAFYLHLGEWENEYRIQSAASGKFLHINGANDNKDSPIVLWSGSGGANTIFKAELDDEGYVHFITRNGYAFDLDGGRVGAGNELQIWSRHNGDAQKFTLIPMSWGDTAPLRPGTYNIRNLAPVGNLYMAVENQGGNGANVFLQNRNGTSNQNFVITGGRGVYGRPTFRIYSTSAKRYIHLQNARFNQGTNALAWEGYGSPQTRFPVHRTRDAEGFVITTPWGFVFEAHGSPDNVRSGANVHLYADVRQPDQRWVFERRSLIE